MRWSTPTNLAKVGRLCIRCASKDLAGRTHGLDGAGVAELDEAVTGVFEHAIDLKAGVLLVRIQADIVASVDEDGIHLDGIAGFRLEGALALADLYVEEVGSAGY